LEEAALAGSGRSGSAGRIFAYGLARTSRLDARERIGGAQGGVRQPMQAEAGLAAASARRANGRAALGGTCALERRQWR
jgi:hypothetical protein